MYVNKNFQYFVLRSSLSGNRTEHAQNDKYSLTFMLLYVEVYMFIKTINTSKLTLCKEIYTYININ